MLNEIDPKTRYAFILILGGIAAIVLILLIASLNYDDGEQAALVIATGTGVIGTLVGTFFGLQAGSAGRDHLERQLEERSTLLLQALANPDATRRRLTAEPAPVATAPLDTSPAE